MSAQQMAELRSWLQEQQTGISLLVSSVPVLLPPFIGLADPIENSLQTKERRLIRGQALITRATYGGLSTRVLPLRTDRRKALSVQNTHVDTYHDLLFENTLAHVTITLRPEQEHKYDIGQEYLGMVDGQLQVIGRTLFSRNITQ